MKTHLPKERLAKISPHFKERTSGIRQKHQNQVGSSVSRERSASAHHRRVTSGYIFDSSHDKENGDKGKWIS